MKLIDWIKIPLIAISLFYVQNAMAADSMLSFEHNFDQSATAEQKATISQALRNKYYFGIMGGDNGTATIVMSTSLPSSSLPLSGNDLMKIMEHALKTNGDKEFAKDAELVARWGIKKDIEAATQLLKDSVGFQLDVPSLYFGLHANFFNWVLKYSVHRKAEVWGHQWKINGYNKAVFTGPGIKLQTFQVLARGGAVNDEGVMASGWTYCPQGILHGLERKGDYDIVEDDIFDLGYDPILPLVSSTFEIPGIGGANPTKTTTPTPLKIPSPESTPPPEMPTEEYEENMPPQPDEEEEKEDQQTTSESPKYKWIFDGTGGWYDWYCNVNSGFDNDVPDWCYQVPLDWQPGDPIPGQATP